MIRSKLIGEKPKIGIRPIIDGRRGGIRESLESMTMTMANKATIIITIVNICLSFKRFFQSLNFVFIFSIF